MNKFDELRQIDVHDYVEKKGQLNYLSWAYAVDLLLKQDPLATWEYKDPILFGETMMVFCTVHAFGKSMTAQLPVMNHRNQAIKNPDAFAVNVAMQRCLAKAIALHGIGLGIYAGEDLPSESETRTEKPRAQGATRISWEHLSDEMKDEVQRCADQVIDIAQEPERLDEAIELIESFCASFPEDDDVKPGLWYRLPSPLRRAIKEKTRSDR